MVEPVVDEAAHLMLAAKQLERQEGANSQLSFRVCPCSSDRPYSLRLHFLQGLLSPSGTIGR